MTESSMSEKESFLTIRNTMAIGMVSIVSFIVLNIIGILVDGTWRPNDMLCELGISDSVVVSTLFTVNCVISGIGMAVCGYGVVRRMIRPWLTLAYIFVSLIGIFLIIVGIFDMNTDIHADFAYGIAYMSGIMMTVMSIDDLLYRKYVWVAVAAAIGLWLLMVLLFIPEYGQSISLVTLFSWNLLRFGSCAKSGEV